MYNDRVLPDYLVVLIQSLLILHGYVVTQLHNLALIASQ
jgi:hypothetical protein